MQFTRQRYQFGSLRKAVRRSGPAVWEFRYRDARQGGRQTQLTLSTAHYPTETHARRALQRFVAELNQDHPSGSVVERTLGMLIDRFVMDERLLEIRAQSPGEASIEGLQYSTACSYLSILEGRLRPQWGEVLIHQISPLRVQDWLRQLTAAPKYKAKIKALLHRLFEKAMLWAWIEVQRNPMQLVEIRGISKRRKRPLVLTMEQFYAVRDQLSEPFRTMVLVAQCLGLRVSEILGIEWRDIDFENLTLRITRKVVNGRVGRLKTEYSEEDLPLDPDFATELLRWREQCPASPESWVFPNPGTGRPYYASEIQKDQLRPAGERAGLGANGVPAHLGWHTFRHTYRSFLDATGAPIGVQQKLMRHAQVSTTMDVYGTALMDSKRQANSKVVKMVLRTTG